MKRSVSRVIVTMGAQSVLLTAFIGAVIGIIGYLKQWDSALPYSNAFFLAGSLIIVAGASSRYAASQERGAFQSLNAESFRGMSSSERAEFIINASSSLRTVILGLLTGLWLILIAAIAAQMS